MDELAGGLRSPRWHAAPVKGVKHSQMPVFLSQTPALEHSTSLWALSVA